MVNPCIPHLKWRRAPQLSSEKRSICYASLSAILNPLCSIFESRTVQKAPLHTKTHSKRNDAARPSYINYRMKSEVSITLRCWLCSTRYTTVRIKNCLTSTSAIKIAAMKNTDDFRYMKGSHHVLSPNRHFSLSAKMNGTQRRTLVSP